MRNSIAIIAVLGLFGASACTDPKSGWGFTLPEGDVVAGEAAFRSLGCASCHVVDGVDDLRAPDFEAERTIVLGGETARIATYGELVSSIINPSHKLVRGYQKEDVAVDGVSKMTVYNDVMTVSELIDLVAFLQSHYRFPDYPETNYYPYH